MDSITRRTFSAAPRWHPGRRPWHRWPGAWAFSLGAAPAIPSTNFGRAGVGVSRLGLGGGGRILRAGPDDEAGPSWSGGHRSRRHVHRDGRQLRPPGDGNMSERRIGLAMKTHRAGAFLETKTDARDHDGAMREIERSLTLLQTDRIDLFLHHNLGRPAELDTIAGPDGAEKAIRKLVDQKVIRFRGFSCHHPALALQAIARLEPDAFQAPINATRNPDFEAEVLPLARSKGIAVSR